MSERTETRTTQLSKWVRCSGRIEYEYHAMFKPGYAVRSSLVPVWMVDVSPSTWIRLKPHSQSMQARASLINPVARLAAMGDGLCASVVRESRLREIWGKG